MSGIWDIRRVAADARAADTAMAARVRRALPDAPFEILAQGQAPSEPADGGRTLFLKTYKGRFLRPCPGTRQYRCCGYRIVHIGENCPMDCSYCILKAYFRDNVLKVWANTDDMFRELATTFDADPSRRFRVGTGEFADSLALEPLTGHTAELLAFLGRRGNVCLELKSKTADLSWLPAVVRPDRVLAAWSVNAPEVSAAEERGAARLEDRLGAARAAIEAGLRVCLHFDPLVHFPGWEAGYARTLEMIGDLIDTRRVAYVSLGSFRCLPELPARLAAEGREIPVYMLGEFVTGLDGKKRLLRPLRVAQFRFLVRGLARLGLDRRAYLCMESDTVWRAAFGYVPAGLAGGAGLARRLSDLAFDWGRGELFS